MQNKSILVIGGTRGLGRAFVKMVAKDNRVTVIGGHEPEKRIDDVNYVIGDISNDPVVSTGEPVDHLLFFQRYRGEPSWDNELAVSLTATKNIIDDIAPNMNEGGSIIIISSIISKFVTSEQLLSYHVCKAGLEQMARWYAVKLGPQGIRVNSVSPCSVMKEESLSFWKRNFDLVAKYLEITPLMRVGECSDIANVCEFLCSDKASFITGQNIIVDGGRTLQNPEVLARRGLDIKVTR